MTTKKHAGSCHCGAVKIAVDLDLDAGPGLVCNCSMCSRSGSMLMFVEPSAFTLVSGEASLTDYQFHNHVSTTPSARRAASSASRAARPRAARRSRSTSAASTTSTRSPSPRSR